MNPAPSIPGGHSFDMVNDQNVEILTTFFESQSEAPFERCRKARQRRRTVASWDVAPLEAVSPQRKRAGGIHHGQQSSTPPKTEHIGADHLSILVFRLQFCGGLYIPIMVHNGRLQCPVSGHLFRSRHLSTFEMRTWRKPVRKSVGLLSQFNLWTSCFSFHEDPPGDLKPAVDGIVLEGRVVLELVIEA
jgi:hypothetical protein